MGTRQVRWPKGMVPGAPWVLMPPDAPEGETGLALPHGHPLPGMGVSHPSSWGSAFQECCNPGCWVLLAETQGCQKEKG